MGKIVAAALALASIFAAVLAFAAYSTTQYDQNMAQFQSFWRQAVVGHEIDGLRRTVRLTVKRSVWEAHPTFHHSASCASFYVPSDTAFGFDWAARSIHMRPGFTAFTITIGYALPDGDVELLPPIFIECEPQRVHPPLDTVPE